MKAKIKVDYFTRKPGDVRKFTVEVGDEIGFETITSIREDLTTLKMKTTKKHFYTEDQTDMGSSHTLKKGESVFIADYPLKSDKCNYKLTLEETIGKRMKVPEELVTSTYELLQILKSASIINETVNKSLARQICSYASKDFSFSRLDKASLNSIMVSIIDLTKNTTFETDWYFVSDIFEEKIDSETEKPFEIDYKGENIVFSLGDKSKSYPIEEGRVLHIKVIKKMNDFLKEVNSEVRVVPLHELSGSDDIGIFSVVENDSYDEVYSLIKEISEKE